MPGPVVPRMEGKSTPDTPNVQQLLSNSLHVSVQQETLQCVDYSGPCFFMNHPAGDAPTHAVPAARLHVPTLLRPAPVPLLAVSLHDVKLLPGTRYHSAQQTNLLWLQSLAPDQLLFWFRNLSGIPQPRGARSHGGWDGGSLRGHILGHYLSAASMAAAATGDALLKRNLENVTLGLEQCQNALGNGYVSGFPDAEFRQMEDYPAPRYAWVPYYVMHKLLAGLVDYHRLWRSSRALAVAVQLAEHLWWRVERILRRGVERWYTFINQEVGGMSEVLTDLAVATQNGTWLVLAARFERPCFVGPLALAYEQQPAQESARLAAHAIERMHGNTHLPQLLGVMARYEATGDRLLRGAAEAFWREIGSHQFVTGGSTVNEVWKGARTLGDVVSQHGQSSFGAHDVHETCVSHNSMRVSRRLLAWGGPAYDGAAHTLEHSEYYERAMLNAVLGTQRGTNPGEMLYMYPMGGGVAKSSRRSGSELHHWGDRTTHWCCQGSGIEAFARLADSIFWLHNPAFDAAKVGERTSMEPREPQLFVLQHISSRFRWHDQLCTIEMHAEAPGSRAAGEPLHTTIRLLASEDAARAATYPAPFMLWVRVPTWAHEATAIASGGLRLVSDGPSPQQLAAGSLLPLHYVREGTHPSDNERELGRVTLRWSMRLRWEKLADGRERFQLLQAAMWGPLVLAALTHGARALPYESALSPVPAEARTQLVSVQHTPPEGNQTQASSGAEGCLITRWESVWVVWQADKSRSFVTAPSKTCLARATSVGEEIGAWAQRDGGRGGRYRLGVEQSDVVCRIYEGCLPGTGESPFASGTLHVMHNGTERSLVLTSRPPVVNGTRRGGTDAANAATWRLTSAPLRAGAAAERGTSAAVYLESFDTPGYVLSGSAATATVVLSRVDNARTALQRWQMVAVPGASERTVQLVSADRSDMALCVVPLPPRKDADEVPQPLPYIGAFASRTSKLALCAASVASHFMLGEAAAEYPPLAIWAAPRANAGPGAPSELRSNFLMFPLNDVVDEHYSVYLCRLTQGARVPPFCVE